ncbi:MAG: hypothetical protein RMI49_01225 [Candidatus Caldarchaeum sp.]|nr:hypothetical protein [Candidatus Caldarchaeum sp.]
MYAVDPLFALLFIVVFFVGFYVWGRSLEEDVCRTSLFKSAKLFPPWGKHVSGS